jgi:predicted nucleic acid-binding protein
MKPIILDTNIVVRLVTSDDKEKQEKAAALFDQVEKGKITAFIPDVIFAEIIFVLVSKKLYNLPKKTIQDILLPIIGLPHVKFHRKRNTKRALEFFVKYDLDFEDALIATYAERGGNTIYSFDSDFEKIPSVIYKQPS